MCALNEREFHVFSPLPVSGRQVSSNQPCRNASCAAVAGSLLALLLGFSATPSQARDRVDVTSVRPLFLAAIEQGEAHGRMIGEASEFMTRMFKTREPMEIDVVTVRSLPEDGCKRLEVTTTQRGAYPDERALKLMTPEQLASSKNGTVPLDVKFSYQISYCRSGRFPKRVGG